MPPKQRKIAIMGYRSVGRWVRSFTLLTRKGFTRKCVAKI